MAKKTKTTYKNWFYLIFRVLVGFMFFSHGAQKVLGIFGGTGASGLGLFSGWIELIVGLLVLLGLFVRPAAFIGALEMLIAYFMAHAGKGALPIMNGGELAALYFAAFLPLVVYGAGKWSLEQALFKKERW